MAKKQRKDSQKNKIMIIYGFMCSGKTTLAKALSKKLNIKFYDTDIEFEKKYGSIYNFIEKNGLKKFRIIERSIFKKLLKNKNSVISAGGGIFPRSKNFIEVFLNPCWEVLKKRLLKNYKTRPLLKNIKNNIYEVKRLYFKRLKKYKKAKYIITEAKRKIVLKKLIKIWNSN